MRGSVLACRRLPAGAVLAAVLVLSGIAKADTIKLPQSGERAGGPGEWFAPAVTWEFNLALAGPQAANEAAAFLPLQHEPLCIGMRCGAGLLWGPFWRGGLSGRPDAATIAPYSRGFPPHRAGDDTEALLAATPEPGTMLLVGVALLLGARIAGRFASRR